MVTSGHGRCCQLPRRRWSQWPSRQQPATESILGDGTTTLFWTDRWIDGQCIKAFAPAVFRAVPKRRHGLTVADAVNNNGWTRDLSGAPTVQLLLDYLKVWNHVQQVQLSQGVHGRLIWRWSSDLAYSAASFLLAGHA